MDHFALVSDQGVAGDLIFQVQIQLAVLGQVQQKCGDVLAVHLAGVIRDRGRQVGRAQDRDAVNVDGFVGLGQLAVAASLGGQVHNYRASSHAVDHFGRDQQIGKDSAVMVRLAEKAFYPAKPPFPLMHVDTTWKFQEMYQLRDNYIAKELGFKLIVHVNEEGRAQGVNPFTHGSKVHTDIMKTQALRQALDTYRF